ncbi:transmembrane protein [Caballeronia hypogeia]|uniref:Transmembrane protein n=1 Tax=Caballeronia hypogeia TaxID=1777140 RepID=A0A158D5J6_9BURK|nr:FimV/HubP family polar landmark protein [Caballeronia hypogeia]SAK89791.1 transmembrane protein [Caballeronia hypogeia]
MIQRPRRSLLSSSRAAFAAGSFAACALFWATPGAALAQASGAEAAAATGQTYAVKPGQSLNDIAGELTGSKDRDVRARAARALFDANPNAFGNHDINKLKLGAMLNVPAELGGAAAPGAAPSAPASATPESAPAQAAASATAAPPSESVTATASAAAPASVTTPEASPTAGAASAPEQTPEAPPATAAPASAPATPAPANHTGVAPAAIGLTPFIVAAVIVLIGFLLLRKRSAKRAAAKADDLDRGARTFSSLEEAQADANARNEALRRSRTQAEGERKPAEQDQTGLYAASTSVGNADAPQTPAAPSDEALPPSTEEKPAASGDQPNRNEPFAPVAPAARHSAFVPPTPDAQASDADAHEQHLREIAAREAARREAEKWEIDEREAAARQAASREAEEREIRAREAAAREALERDLAGRESESRDAELRHVTEREEQAREAAAREIIAREAELRELQARNAEEEAAEQRAAEQRAIEERAAVEAEKAGLAPDDEPVMAHRFPMPKFPQEAIQALDSLDMELPPRMEVALKAPDSGQPVTSASPTAGNPPLPTLGPPPRDAHAESAPSQTGAPPIGHVPFVPQPVAAHDPAQQAQAATRAQSVASQIEAGTAGAASVAGLGATRYGPLSLDFDLGHSSAATEHMPALTPAQLATIARNKLELAAEYIELGDLQGARTLLQEVIESNDPATRQQAATLLSTLAPHS